MNDIYATAPDSPSLRHRVLAQQIALMCRLSIFPLFGSACVGATMVYLAAPDYGLRASLGWYLAFLTVVVARFCASRRFLQRPRDNEQIGRWRAGMLFLIALFGALWSIPPTFLLPMSPEKETVMTVFFIAATAAGMGSLSPMRHAYVALLVPFILPYAIQHALMGGDHVLTAITFGLYVPLMTFVGSRQTKLVEEQIRLSIDNEILARELQLERDRVQVSNRELQVQVEQLRISSERVRLLNRDLELQAAELKAANNDLEGFSYSVSHDLRGPLRAIDGFASLLKESRSGEHGHSEHGDSDHYVLRIRENIARMSMLIDDLLAFSRCGRQPLAMVELDMHELAQAAAREVGAAWTAQESVDIRIEPLPRVRGDQSLMLQVLINLLDNAVKYSSKVARPTVLVRSDEEDDRVVYQIIDNGVGFDSRYSSRLFGVFERLHGQREYPGTGVGLAIVHRIVTRHGGEVWAASELGKGATFSFALPRTNVSSLTANQVVSAAS